MLYDKRWDRTETKPDMFSLESLIAWLETKNTNEMYDFYCSGECLLGQWVRAIDPNASEPYGRGSFTYLVHDQVVDLDRYNAVTEPWTFGAALNRASASQ